MDTDFFRAWCEAKRGRLSRIARALGLDRQYVHQWTRGIRPIPEDKMAALHREMLRDERTLDAKPVKQNRRASR
jgi:transcriptional regulator with XRE-family HTH domain